MHDGVLPSSIPRRFHQDRQEAPVFCVSMCPTMTFPQCTIPRPWGGSCPWPLRIMVAVPSRAVYVVCIHRSFAVEARFQDLFRLCCPASGATSRRWRPGMQPWECSRISAPAVHAHPWAVPWQFLCRLPRPRSCWAGTAPADGGVGRYRGPHAAAVARSVAPGAPGGAPGGVAQCWRAGIMVTV